MTNNETTKEHVIVYRAVRHTFDIAFSVKVHTKEIIFVEECTSLFSKHCGVEIVE